MRQISWSNQNRQQPNLRPPIGLSCSKTMINWTLERGTTLRYLMAAHHSKGRSRNMFREYSIQPFLQWMTGARCNNLLDISNQKSFLLVWWAKKISIYNPKSHRNGGGKGWEWSYISLGTKLRSNPKKVVLKVKLDNNPTHLTYSQVSL